MHKITNNKVKEIINTTLEKIIDEKIAMHSKMNRKKNIIT